MLTGMKTGESIAAAEFPPELWVEILVRLPAKALVRIRCVSKTWRSIIDNPKFIHMHLNLCKNNSSKNLLLYWEKHIMEMHPGSVMKTMLWRTDEFREFEEIMSLHDSARGFTYLPISHTDGLMLIERLRFNPFSYEYILFNPSIRKLLVLPPPPPCDIGDFWVFLGLDPLSNEHKVFMIRFPRSPIRDLPYITVADYAQSTGCWSNTRTRKDYHYGWNLGMSLYAKGVMHWTYREKSAVGDPTGYAGILSFDLATEAFSLTSLPGDQGYNSEKVRIAFLLGDAFATLDISSASACIWELKQCGGSKTDSWSKWSEGPSDSDTLELFQQHLYCMGLFKTLYSEEIRNFLLAVKGDKIGDQMKSYDIDTGMMKDLENSPRGHMIDLMGPYVESLLLANASGGHSWTSIPEENRSRRFDPCTP